MRQRTAPVNLRAAATDSTLTWSRRMLFAMLGPIFLSAAGLFVVGSFVYVYGYRGELRYTGVREYVRKGWPIFAPPNCMLYLLTRPRARHVFMDLAEFPELAPVTRNWQTIRAEALKLYEAGYFQKTVDRG